MCTTARILKKSSNAISTSLASIFNCSAESHRRFLSLEALCCNTSTEKEDMFDVNNYSPIYTLTIISKLCLVFEQMLNFLESNRFKSYIQHCFRKGLSCLTALIKLSRILFTTNKINFTAFSRLLTAVKSATNCCIVFS